MSIIKKLLSYFKKKEPEVIKLPSVVPEGYIPIDSYYPYSDVYINNEGYIYDRTRDIYYNNHRYTKIYGIYHYLPKILIEVFNNLRVNNIHQIQFKDNDRNNWKLSNLYIVDPDTLGYFVINAYTHSVAYNVKGTLREEEYLIYMKDLLDHNWTPMYREWLTSRVSPSDVEMNELIVDPQEKTIIFRLPKRGIPLGQPIKGKIVYKVICDNFKKDFWIIPPRKRSIAMRDLARMDSTFSLKK